MFCWVTSPSHFGCSKERHRKKGQGLPSLGLADIPTGIFLGVLVPSKRHSSERKRPARIPLGIVFGEQWVRMFPASLLKKPEGAPEPITELSSAHEFLGHRTMLHPPDSAGTRRHRDKYRDTGQKRVNVGSLQVQATRVPAVSSAFPSAFQATTAFLHASSWPHSQPPSRLHQRPRTDTHLLNSIESHSVSQL